MTDASAIAVPGRLDGHRPPANTWLRPVAVAGLVATVAGVATVLALLAAGATEGVEGFNSTVSFVLQMIGMAGLALAGATLARHRPREPIAWLMLGSAAAWVAGPLALLAALTLLARGHELALWAGWLTNWIWVPAQGLTTIMLLRFPNGRLPGRRWRVAEALVLAWTGLTTLTTAVLPGPLGAPALESLPNPLGVRVLEGISSPLLSGLFAVLPGLVVLACAAPVLRWRRAGERDRRALRWLALAALVVAVAAPLALLAEAGAVLQGVAFLLLPVAVGAAVVRDQLWGLDLRVRYDRLHAARLQERERLRRELHDSLGPALGSLSMRAEAARNLLARGETGRIDELLASIGTTTEEALGEVRRLIDDLGPAALQDQDLGAAVSEHVGVYADTFPITVSLHPDPLPDLDERAAATAYLVVVEAVRNAARHSGGAGARVRLAVVGDRLEVGVHDDGRGLTGSVEGTGRRGMARRAAAVGAELSVQEAVEGGCTVRLTVPGALR
ncbi:sensor histidine kinase [Ornithinimicrobium flavum]|uniref:sensor histidine kinase n=1 Tax=Ornithinimicrobium flavum TaxID=1288636 RepID=UPI0010701F40|nr:histidine kinase [Ornithinimicrobium flavum]